MKNKKKFTLTRRDFLKTTGLTAAAVMMPASVLSSCSSGYTTNPGVIAEPTGGQRTINTDILVIGGGMAGAFAAVAAREKGLNVTLVDKGTVGRSGQTPWANGFSVFDEEEGNDRDEWISGVSASSEYLNNLDWLEQNLNDSKTRWNDIEAWGLMDGDVQHPSLMLRDKMLEEGVELVERTMITTLLTEDESAGSRVIGAMGFTIDNEETIVVLAKATVLCAGAGSFKAPGFPIQCLTSDGDAIAYRAGAVISGKEFVDFHWTSLETPASCWNQWSGMWNTGIGKNDSVFTAGMTLSSAYSAHAGEASVSGDASSADMGPPPSGDGDMPEGDRPEGGPPDGDAPEGEGEDGRSSSPAPGQSSGVQVLGAATGMGIHKAEGVWPTNMQGGCNVPGLYAAGDALASMLCGASYAGLGLSLSGSAVQGMIAGQGAAEDALLAAAPSLSDDKIASLQTAMLAARMRETGFTPAWVTQVLQNTMFPYYVMMVKSQDRLEAALTTIMFLQENMVPNLVAQDTHDLRLAHETVNMLLNAEMKLRASLARTESRGTHYREDYPARNDDEWLAWVLLSQDPDGEMAVTKEEVPDKWKPDLSIPYVERYTNRFPGELAYLGLD